MRNIIHNARVRQRLRRIKEASKPIDYINFAYDCEGRVKQSRAELEESMKKWRKEA